MKLKVKILCLEAGGKPIVVLNQGDAEDLGIKSLSRVCIKTNGKTLTSIVNIATKIIPRGYIGVYEGVVEHLELKENCEVEVDVAKYPSSLQYIRQKLKGRRLSYDETLEIVKDVVAGNLSEIEIASFVTSLNDFGLNLDEVTSLTLSMVETGEQLKLDKKIICDKHSIGGCVGDKTSLILVPIVAAAGLTIPKTSSRAITSAGGTADRAECLMPVELGLEEMKNVIEKTNACIVWGGSLHLAPADDIFIKVEYPLSIDPLLLPSIMSKKKAVGANNLVIDIPCGRGTKIKTIGEAEFLAKDFIELSGRIGIKTRCAITRGEQPIGYNIGPALEAKEALEILMRRKKLPDIIDKVTDIAGILFEMVGKTNGKEIALDILNSGKAEEKMREIIMQQGGNEEVKPEDIEIGGYGIDFTAKNNGNIFWMDNSELVEIARAAGAPRDKGSGIQLYKKIGDSVKKGEKLFSVYAEKSRKLERVNKILEEEEIIGVGERMKMLITQIKEAPTSKKTFILER